MKLETWGRNGVIYKYPGDIERLKIGLHTHVSDGKTYLSVQIDGKELMLGVVLVNVAGIFDPAPNHEEM